MRTALLWPLAVALSASAFGQTPLDCGAVTDGAAAQNFANLYTIQARAGDAISIRLLVTSAGSDFSPGITLSSNGRALAPRAGGIVGGATLAGIFDLPSDGSYQIAVSNPTQSQTGRYKLVYVFLNRPCSSGALACGSGRQDQIADVLQLRTYSFPAAAGDIVSLRFAKQAPFTNIPATPSTSARIFAPVIAVYSPSGQLMTTAAGAPAAATATTSAVVRIDFPVPADGVLTVLVLDPNNLSGNYVLSMTYLNRPCGSGVVDCGKVVQGNIPAALSVDTYSVSMAAGDIGSIRTAALGTDASFVPAVELYDPSGAAVVFSAASLPSSRAVLLFNFAVKQSGSYTLIVRDAVTLTGTGAYAVTMVRFNRPCAAENLSCSSTVDGAITGILGTKLYAVSASANDVFLVRVLRSDQSGAFRPRVDVYDPQANSVTSVVTADLGRQTFTANSTGLYTLVVSDGNDASQSGAYSLVVQRLNRPCNSSVLTCGAPAGGALPPLGTPAFTYTAAPGESFTVRMADPTGALQPAIEIYDANGLQVGQNLSGNFTGVDVVQPAGGVYTILAMDNRSRPTGGPFGLALLRTVNACAVPAPQGQTIQGAATGVAPFLSYTIPAAAGDRLLLRSASSTPGFAAQMELYDPAGARLDSQTFSISRQAAAAGNYTVIVEPSAPRSVGGFGFAWQALNNPANATPLVCGASAAGSLTPATPFRFYSAGAAAADVLRLILTKGSDSFSPRVDLYDPSGAFVASTLDLTQKAKLDGNYLVLVSPSSSNGETGSYTLALQRPNNPCSPVSLTCGQTTLQQVRLPGQLDAFVFPGNAGDRANLKLSQRSGGYTPSAELYDTAGTRLAASSSGSLIATLPASGSYSVLVRDTTGVTTGSYRIALQNDTNVCKVNDTEAPSLTLLQPTGGEVIGGGTGYLVQWLSDDNVGVATHDVALSTDGGKTFGTPIATGLGPNTQSFAWQAPPDIAPTRTAVVRVTATDAAGNATSAVSGPLTIIGAGFTPNRTATYTYDSLNRLIQAALDSGMAITYRWDAAGNLVEIMVSQP